MERQYLEVEYAKDEDERTVFSREAAVVALEKLLSTKTRGSRITAQEITEATGDYRWRSFYRHVAKWGKTKGFVLFPVTNDGWRFGNPNEHLDFSEKLRQAALRREKRSLKSLADTPIEQLSDVDNRRHAFVSVRAMRRVNDASRDDAEIKKQFKLENFRVPLK